MLVSDSLCIFPQIILLPQSFNFPVSPASVHPAVLARNFTHLRRFHWTYQDPTISFLISLSFYRMYFFIWNFSALNNLMLSYGYDSLLSHQEPFPLLPASVAHLVEYRDNSSYFSPPRLQEMNACDWLDFSFASFPRSSWQDFGLPKC